MPTPEGSLRATLVKKLTAYKGQGLVSWSHADVYTSGLPDIALVYCGRYIAIELKADDGVLRPLQKKTLADISRAGGLALVVRRHADRGQFLASPYPTGEGVRFSTIDELLCYVANHRADV